MLRGSYQGTGKRRPGVSREEEDSGEKSAAEEQREILGKKITKALVCEFLT